VCTGDANPNFSDPRTNRLHRFPVIWIQSLLHTPQLETSQPSSKSGKRPKVTPRAAEPQLNYLQFSDADWMKWNNRFLYQNRLRAIDFVDMARAEGFVIEIDTSRPHPLRLQQLDTIKVHPQFARYSREQLAITSIDFIGRNPSSKAAHANSARPAQ